MFDGGFYMLAILYFLIYAACGCAIVYFLLPRLRLSGRIWLGLSLGLALEMWLPALCAFIWDFSMTAHFFALLPLTALTIAAFFGRNKAPEKPLTPRDRREGLLLLCIALPLTLIGGYLQWTHNIMPAADGSLHVGQSTYGDLPLHLSIITSLRDAKFPPDYAIMPGERLCYPFLSDSLSTTFLLMGFSLRASVVFPGIYMMALVFSGYVLLACRLAERKGAAALAVLLFFINGGLGFLYLVDMKGTVQGTMGSNELQSVSGLWNRIRLVLEGWYQTPANHAEFGTYNLRWSNVIVDMMVPQRTTLAGWTQVIPCLYLLYDCLRPEGALPAGIHFLKKQDGPTAVVVKRKNNYREIILLGVWAGMLPMINTHCFLALGLVSLGWMVWDLVENRKGIYSALALWAVYGALAVALALPQLLTWTFRQSMGSTGFVRLGFNWVNGEMGMADGYFWFYLKNIGLPFLLLLMAVLEKNRHRRFLACSALPVLLAAELFIFQPNAYDNNKLLYIWYMLCAVIAADYGLELLARLKGLRAKPVIAVLCAVCFFATGTLSIAREIVSDYQMFGAEDVQAAEFVEAQTDKGDMFLTGTQHINFVSSLAGRKIVCGPDMWLYYHGLDTTERKEDIRRFYADPLGNMDVPEKYGVRYILLGGNEAYNYTVDRAALEQNFPLVYESESGGIRIYAVPGA